MVALYSGRSVGEMAKIKGRFNFLPGLAGAMTSAGATLSQLFSEPLLDYLGSTEPS